MFKRLIICLVAVGLVTIFTISANAFYWRGRGTVENFHNCKSGESCYDAEKVVDRLFGAVEVDGVLALEDCDYFWDSENGKCWQPTCEMTGTVVCEESGGDCGLLEFTDVGIDQDSFQSEAYFTSEDTATGIGLLTRDLGVEACGNYGIYSDYKPNAIMGLSSYYIKGASDPFYEFIDVCPDFQPDPSDPFKRDKFNCKLLWSSLESVEQPHLPCCGVTNTLTVQIETGGGGTVTSSDGKINCDTTITPCVATYGGTVAPYDGCPEVVLTATPDLGYEFTGWSGSDCSGPGECIVTPTANVTATFKLGNNTLRVEVYGDGTKDSVWIFSPRSNFDVPNVKYCTDICIVEFDVGTYVVLKRKKGTFDEWAGICKGTPNSVQECKILIDGDGGKNAIANFLN